MRPKMNARISINGGKVNKGKPVALPASASVACLKKNGVAAVITFAKIKNNVLFVGLGKTFQIWDPKNFEKFRALARKKAFQNRSNLKWENKQKGE